MAYKHLYIKDHEQFEICYLKNGKGNPLGSEVLLELLDYFKNFKERNSKGVILTGEGSIFTVGLDMKEMLQLNSGEFQEFFQVFLELVHEMVSFPFPFITAINGHSPAGGCVLALCSDFRVMVDDEKFKIGLNELPVGIMIPPAIFHLYAFWIGHNAAYQNMLTGRLLNPLEAKNQGLVQEIVPFDSLLNVAISKMSEYLSFDQPTWSGIKSNIRLSLLSKMKEDAGNSHLGPVEHFVRNDGKKILLKALQSLKSN